ncbi:3964_t:CDS:2 [Scutellospora calospora]|uniref:3964_t:CDS:1 n=1 Tax=Scutellospora calospora TaxID=85575 RepID=A0ACA9JXM5_9GLOM|nr:3964_t:CDS:2 [Scutellospora calospora]
MPDDLLCVRYSPNQKLISVALLDATVKLTKILKYEASILEIVINQYSHIKTVSLVHFVQGTHYYIFTASKDKLVKYWDGDKLINYTFENITKLEGHHGEVWALAISKRGDLFISGSHDRSIRVWEQTDEQLFLEEEREKRSQLQLENKSWNTKSWRAHIIEALDIANDNATAWETYSKLKERGQDPGPPPKPNPILVTLGNLTGDQYVLRTIEKMRSSELEEALLICHLLKLFLYSNIWTCGLKRICWLTVLKYIKRDWENNNTAEFFDDIFKNEEISSGSLTKRKFINLTV